MRGATLIVVADPLSSERREYSLRLGETLAHALVRLWPSGLSGSWRIYAETVAEAHEIAAADLPVHVVLKGETYLVVRDMAGPAVGPFLGKLLISMVLSAAATALMGKGRRRPNEVADLYSPNNALAGQSNQLRPGARVPEIMGRVRSYPDLLCMPVDVYTETQQSISQLFVIGVGAYDISEAKLGETPLSSIPSATARAYLPREGGVRDAQPVPPFFAMKASPEVSDISLLAENVVDVPATPGTDFVAATKTMSAEKNIGVGVGRPITISGSLFNNRVYWVTAIPPQDQVTPPFVYTLDGPVEDELNANTTFLIGALVYEATKEVDYGKATNHETEDEAEIFQVVPFGDEVPIAPGHLIEFVRVSGTAPGNVWRGRITSTQVQSIRGNLLLYVKMNDLNGVPIRFPSLGSGVSAIKAYNDSGSGATPPSEITNAFTPWYAAPLADPDEIWVDIEFPQGLAWYKNGSRQTLHVDVRVEFRRTGATAAQAVKEWPFYYATNAPLRFTKRHSIAYLLSLGLPDNSQPIEVRVQRPTQYFTDSQNNQYVQETKWARLAAVRQLPEIIYQHATVVALSLSNTRSATAIGQTTFNCVATRILPTWDGAAWSAPEPTARWADNFVARCKARDGAALDDAHVDLAGIYALQAQLDALDEGAQGRVGLTLDVIQDVDSELAQVADLVRAVVYRVGRKVFVTRDQANSTTLALFNARTKSPDGEAVAVRMTGDADNDCVIVTWVDESLAWKRREYRYPETALAINPLNVATVCANWAQAWRRAVFEWNRLKYRREVLTCNVTEDGRICRPGDVVNVTDDIANLAQTAGEVLEVAGGTLTLDRDVTFEAGESYSILLRDLEGQLVDRIPCTAVSGHPDRVLLARAPGVGLKGRDTSTGSLFAFYPDSKAAVRPWLITGVAVSGPFVELSAVNYSPKVYDGDAAPLGTRPVLPALIRATGGAEVIQ